MSQLRFSESHEWVRLDGDIATIGISAFAVESLTDLVYVELPTVGRRLTSGETFGVVESVKAVSDLYAPVSGEVTAANTDLPTNLEWLSESPYDRGWIVKLRISDPGELSKLMDEAAYKTFCEHAAH